MQIWPQELTLHVLLYMGSTQIVIACYHFSLNALPKISKDLFTRDREILRTMKDLSESFLFQKHQRLPIWIKIEYFILGPYTMTDCILTHLGTNHNKSCPCVSLQVMSSS